MNSVQGGILTGSTNSGERRRKCPGRSARQRSLQVADCVTKYVPKESVEQAGVWGEAQVCPRKSQARRFDVFNTDGYQEERQLPK